MFDPNWLAAIGQCVAAVGTIAAVVVALRIANESGKQAREQSSQLHYDAMRPVLVIHGEDDLLPRSPNGDLWLNWSANEIKLHIYNAGNGPALNIASVIYGAESYMVGEVGSQKRVGDTKETHWTCWDGNYLKAGEDVFQCYKLGASTFYEESKHIRKHLFNAPAQPPFSFQPREDTYICRVVTTYHDIAGRKYASIFDYRFIPRSWVFVALEEDITEDLHDLEAHSTK